MAKVVKRSRNTDKRPRRTDPLIVMEFRERISAWHEMHGRDFPWRRAATCYERTIAELLLQRTRASTVARFYPKFIEKYPSWDRLAKASEEDLQELLKGIGLWRRRAQTLVGLATVMSQTGGRLPATRRELEQLPGISQYIASAVRLLCYGERELLLDANGARVLERVFGRRELADIRYDPFLQTLRPLIVNAGDPIRVNWGILDLAATVCLINSPRCLECPLAEICRFAKGK